MYVPAVDSAECLLNETTVFGVSVTTAADHMGINRSTVINRHRVLIDGEVVRLRRNNRSRLGVSNVRTRIERTGAGGK